MIKNKSFGHLTCMVLLIGQIAIFKYPKLKINKKKHKITLKIYINKHVFILSLKYCRAKNCKINERYQKGASFYQGFIIIF